MDSEQTGLSFEQTLDVLRRRGVWILLCLVLVTGLTYGYSKHKTKMYTAAAGLTFNNNQLDQQIAGLSIGSSLTPLTQQQSNLELLRTGDMAVKTAKLLDHGLEPATVVASVSASGDAESNTAVVSATSTSPKLAAAIANTYAEQFVIEKRRADRRFYKSALAQVTKQLAGLSPEQRFGADGLDLQTRAHTIGLLSALVFNDVEVTQEALAPSVPSSPKVAKDTVLGVVLGLLLGLGVALLLERFDRRIRKSEDLEAIYRLPTLGVVPKSAALSGTTPPSAEAEAEAFSLIHAHLRFFNLDHDLRTVVIASPAPGDGKTTIARHLAGAAARLGSRVLLLEVDLRHPTLARQLGIQSGPGLAEVLIGAVAIGEATQSVDLGTPPGNGTRGHTLDVLAAGTVLPPNPGELLESSAMDFVLERAKSTYDLVVVDTPPLTSVSDAFPLLTKVDGVIIVGWIGRSRRDIAEQLEQVLAGSGASLLGVIANGSKSGGPTPYRGDGKSSPTASSATGASS